MTSRIALLTAVLATMLAACSDPLDDEPKGQTIPTHAELATSYAAGSGPAVGGSGIPASSSARSADEILSGSPEGGADMSGSMPAGLVSQAQGAGGGGATGPLPPAGLQGAAGRPADGAGQGSCR